MPKFESEMVGGPACGMKLLHNRAPRCGDAQQWKTNDFVHMYLFKACGSLPPQWRHEGVIGKVATESRTP